MSPKGQTVKRGLGTLVVAVLAVSCGSDERTSGSPTPDPVRIEAESEGVRYALAQACIPAGGKQTLMVHTEGGNGATLTTRYADGKTGHPKPFGAGYGGHGAFVAGAEGVAEKSWDVARNAPPGPVTVEVRVLLPGQNLVTEELSFVVVRRGEKCP